MNRRTLYLLLGNPMRATLLLINAESKYYEHLFNFESIMNLGRNGVSGSRKALIRLNVLRVLGTFEMAFKNGTYLLPFMSKCQKMSLVEPSGHQREIVGFKTFVLLIGSYELLAMKKYQKSRSS